MNNQFLDLANYRGGENSGYSTRILCPSCGAVDIEHLTHGHSPIRVEDPYTHLFVDFICVEGHEFKLSLSAGKGHVFMGAEPSDLLSGGNKETT